MKYFVSRPSCGNYDGGWRGAVVRRGCRARAGIGSVVTGCSGSRGSTVPGPCGWPRPLSHGSWFPAVLVPGVLVPPISPGVPFTGPARCPCCQDRKPLFPARAGLCPVSCCHGSWFPVFLFHRSRSLRALRPPALLGVLAPGRRPGSHVLLLGVLLPRFRFRRCPGFRGG